MKNINEILSGFGITIPEDKQTEFMKLVNENYKTMESNFTRNGHTASIKIIGEELSL